MGMTASDYLTQYQALLPTGQAWPREPDTVITQFWDALAQELARADSRADDLLREIDPRLTSELLPDWERVAGLPDPCVTATQTTQERRDALYQRVVNVGGQSIAFFVALVARLGYTVTITEFRPYSCEMDCETPVYEDTWAYAWQVNAATDTVREATCEDSCEDPLRSWGNELLECVVSRLTPAHARVLFAYS